MKKEHKNIIPIVVVLTIVILSIILLRCFYFNVAGSEIEGVNDITMNSSVTVTKMLASGEELRGYDLNVEQIEKLKTLIIGTNFTRVLSNEVYYYDSNIYEISINNSGQVGSLIISSLGGEYISVSFQFNGKHLKIKNLDWKETLEEILSLTD